MKKKIAKIEQMLDRLRYDASWKMIEHTVYLAYIEGKNDGMEDVLKKLNEEVK